MRIYKIEYILIEEQCEQFFFLCQFFWEISKEIIEGYANINQETTEKVFNRDTSVLMAQIYLNQQTQIKQNQQFKILDAMSASGLRALRYAHEIDENIQLEIVSNDISEEACKAIKYNINNQQRQIPTTHVIKINQQDCNTYMQQNQNTFDIIDIDPYGAPSQFIPYAIKSLKNYGLLSVTATDGLITCGHQGIDECIKRYQSIPAQAEFCHEFSVRMVIGQIALTAISQRCNIKVLFGFYMYHYLRVYVQIIKKSGQVQELTDKIRNILYCKHCGYSKWTNSIFDQTVEIQQNKCSYCNQKLYKAGPVYSGQLAQKDILQIISQQKQTQNIKCFDQIQSLTRFLNTEIEFNTLQINIPNICSINKNSTLPKTTVYNYLVSRGYKCVNTVFSPNSIKTDANDQIILELFKWWNVVCQLYKKQEIKEYNGVKMNKQNAEILIKKQFIDISQEQLQNILDLTTSEDSQINVSPHQDKNCEFEQLRKIKMFQGNPEKNFGPKKMK